MGDSVSPWWVKVTRDFLGGPSPFPSVSESPSSGTTDGDEGWPTSRAAYGSYRDYPRPRSRPVSRQSARFIHRWRPSAAAVDRVRRLTQSGRSLANQRLRLVERARAAAAGISTRKSRARGRPAPPSRAKPPPTQTRRDQHHQALDLSARPPLVQLPPSRGEAAPSATDSAEAAPLPTPDCEPVLSDFFVASTPHLDNTHAVSVPSASPEVSSDGIVVLRLRR